MMSNRSPTVVSIASKIGSSILSVEPLATIATVAEHESDLHTTVPAHASIYIFVSFQCPNRNARIDSRNYGSLEHSEARYNHHKPHCKPNEFIRFDLISFRLIQFYFFIRFQRFGRFDTNNFNESLAAAFTRGTRV